MYREMDDKLHFTTLGMVLFILYKCARETRARTSKLPVIIKIGCTMRAHEIKCSQTLIESGGGHQAYIHRARNLLAMHWFHCNRAPLFYIIVYFGTHYPLNEGNKINSFKCNENILFIRRHMSNKYMRISSVLFKNIIFLYDIQNAYENMSRNI